MEYRTLLLQKSLKKSISVYSKLQYPVQLNCAVCTKGIIGGTQFEFSSSDYLVPAQPSVSNSGQFAICQLWMRLKIQF